MTLPTRGDGTEGSIGASRGVVAVEEPRNHGLLVSFVRC